MRAQVGIVGGGPVGLLLSHLLHRRGIESVVLEHRDREHVEQRVRAGVLEQGTVDLLAELGLDGRLRREGLVQHGIELRFGGRAHRIPLSELTGGRVTTIYGQREVVRDLIEARLAARLPLLFEVDGISLHNLDSERPSIRFRHDGSEHELRCDVVAGCDGFHGVSREAIPEGVLSIYSREYPFGWLGILAAVAPSTDELIFARHERGFALHTFRSPQVSRLYVQCRREEDLSEWPDERIWDELELRLGVAGWTLNRGPILEKRITSLRSFVAEPIQYGRLYLAGDAAHIVPPTGAKGLNLAAADVRVLADALERWYRSGDITGLDGSSSTCLRRIWRAEHFTFWMTSLLHRFDEADGFDAKMQLAQLEYICSSKAAATTLAENYVGLDQF